MFSWDWGHWLGVRVNERRTSHCPVCIFCFFCCHRVAESLQSAAVQKYGNQPSKNQQSQGNGKVDFAQLLKLQKAVTNSMQQDAKTGSGTAGKSATLKQQADGKIVKKGGSRLSFYGTKNPKKDTKGSEGDAQITVLAEVRNTVPVVEKQRSRQRETGTRGFCFLAVKRCWPCRGSVWFGVGA